MSTICEGRSVGNSENFIRQYLGQSLRWGFIMSKHCHALIGEQQNTYKYINVGEDQSNVTVNFEFCCVSVIPA